MIEIRLTADGKGLQCDWGIFENSSANSLRECGIKKLMLITPELYQELCEHGPQSNTNSVGTLSASAKEGRRFAYLDFEGQHWAWELYDADWWDGEGPEMLVGKWPD